MPVIANHRSGSLGHAFTDHMKRSVWGRIVSNPRTRFDLLSNQVVNSRFVGLPDKSFLGRSTCTVTAFTRTPGTGYSPSNVTCTSFTSLISVMTIACVPLRSNTIPLTRTYLPTKGISFCLWS